MDFSAFVTFAQDGDLLLVTCSLWIDTWFCGVLVMVSSCGFRVGACGEV